MITFKEFLTERLMGSADLERALVRTPDAKVGFEFEMFVDPETFGIHENKADVIDIDKINDLDDVERYFQISFRERREYERNKERWVQDRIKNYAEDIWQDHLDDDTDEYDAKEKAMNVAEEELQGLTFEDYLQDQYSKPYFANFIRDENLEPRYGWVYGFENEMVYAEVVESEINPHELYKALQKDLEKEEIINSDWNITDDPSLTGLQGFMGVEIISPPESLSDGLISLSKMFRWMRVNGCVTTKIQVFTLM